MTEKEAFLAAIGKMSDTVHLLEASQLGDPTPDSEWTVKELLSHVIGEALWIPDIFGGKTIEEVGDKYDGDVVGVYPKEAWLEAAILAEAAIHHLDDLDKTVHLSFGDMPARAYLRMMILDLTIHIWDLANAIKVDDELPEDLVQSAWDILEVEAESWRNNGAFGPAISVPKSAPLQTKLLALSGRKR